MLTNGAEEVQGDTWEGREEWRESSRNVSQNPHLTLARRKHI
jgi:hypothetical protein